MVDMKKISKFGAESVLYAGVTLTLQYTLSEGYWEGKGWSPVIQLCVSLSYSSHTEKFLDPQLGISLVLQVMSFMVCCCKKNCFPLKKLT